MGSNVLTLQYVSKKNYNSMAILKIIKQSKKKKICYVTFSKSYNSLIELFKKEKININRFYFIDCITLLFKRPKKTNNYDLISSPWALNEIRDSLRRAINKGYTTVIFDSLSNLLIYSQIIPAGAKILINFLRSFSPNLKKVKSEAFFICKLEDKRNPLILETFPEFDKIIGGA